MSPANRLLAGTFARGGAAAATSDQTWLRTMLDVEVALASAAAAVGLVAPAAAAAVATAADHLAATADLDELGQRAAASGNPVVPLVPMLRDELLRQVRQDVGEDPALAAAVHVAATSQDVLDTTLVLIARRACVSILSDAAACVEHLARLASTHRDHPTIGRTLMQQALPTTFGLKAAMWAASLDRAAAGLSEEAAAAPLQYGGPVGTLVGVGGGAAASLELRHALAAALSLPEPALSWHTDRTPVASLACALGVLAGAASHVATDLVLLASSEVAEVSEGGEGGERRGGSSSMAHKHNPVAAISARACAARCPGLVSTMLMAMSGEHERAAGAWHSEWETLADLLRLVGSCVAWLRDGLEHLVVDTASMRTHAEQAVAATNSTIDIGAAGELVDGWLASRPVPATRAGTAGEQAAL